MVATSPPYECMEFVVGDQPGAGREWVCIGGTSRDLANENVTFTATGRFQAVTGTWDRRFPYFLISFGQTKGTAFGRQDDDAWYRLEAKALFDRAGVTEGSTSLGDSLEVNIAGADDWNRRFYFRRTSSDGILVATDNTSRGARPLRIRGSA